MKSPFFYELEIDKGAPFDDAVSRYCANAPLLAHHNCPRVELLFPRGLVVSATPY